MTNPKDDGSGNVKVHKIKNRLKMKLSCDQRTSTGDGYLPAEGIEEADRMIEVLCEGCTEAIGGYLDKLIEAWVEMRDMEQCDKRQEISDKIFTLSHEIKDISSMCGYALIAYFAESLRDYIARTELNMKAQRVIIQAHLDAIKLTHRNDIKDDANPLAEELKQMVGIAIGKYS